MNRIRVIPPELVVALLLFGGGLLLLAPGYIPVVGHVIKPIAPAPVLPNNAAGTPSATATANTCDGFADKPTYLALTSKDKESQYAFGNPIDIKVGDSDAWGKTMNAILTTVHKDPSITAALTTVFDPDGDWSKVDNRTASYIGKGNQRIWCSEALRMYDVASGAFQKLVSIDANQKTLCMRKSAGDVAPVKVYTCRTASSGTAALFKWKDSEGTNRTVRLRLDCHLQPVGGSYPGVPSLPKSKPKPTHTTPATHHTVPSRSTPKPKPSPKSTAADPAPRGHATTGGGTNKDPGPGKSVAPSDAPTVPSDPYTPPPPPSVN